MLNRSRLKLLKKNYFVKPDDELIFVVEEENPDITIIASFGDNSQPVETKSKKIRHAYKKVGLFTAKFQLYLGCRSNNRSLEVSVKVESLVVPLEDLEVTSKAQVLGLESLFSLTVKKGNLFKCTWNFGDDTSDIITEYKNQGGRHLVKHTYRKTGSFNGTVTCENRSGRKQKTLY